MAEFLLQLSVGSIVCVQARPGLKAMYGSQSNESYEVITDI